MKNLLIPLLLCLLISCTPSVRTAQPADRIMTIVEVTKRHAYARWKWELYRGPVDTFKVGDRFRAIPGNKNSKNLFIRIK